MDTLDRLRTAPSNYPSMLILAELCLLVSEGENWAEVSDNISQNALAFDYGLDGKVTIRYVDDVLMIDGRATTGKVVRAKFYLPDMVLFVMYTIASGIALSNQLAGDDKLIRWFSGYNGYTYRLLDKQG